MAPSFASAPALAEASARLGTVNVRVRVALADPVLLGFVGALLVGAGSFSLGVTPKPDPLVGVPLVGLLRSTSVGQALGGAAVLLGVAAIVTAWLALGRDLRAGFGPSPARLTRAMWLWSAPLILTPPLFSRDLYSYAAQANMVRHGYDPYVMGPSVLLGPFSDSVDPMWATSPAPYGPLFLQLAGLVSRVTGESVYLTVLGMRGLALLGVWLLLRYVPRLARACGVQPGPALWLGVVNPLTLMHFVSGGHNDALMVGLIVAALALTLEGNPLTGSAVIALAAGIKAPAALLLAVTGAVWARRLTGGAHSGGEPIADAEPVFLARRRLLVGYALAGATALATFAALTAAAGVGYGWIAALDTPGSVRTLLSPPTALGMLAGAVSWSLNLGLSTWLLVDVFRKIGTVATLAVLAWLFLRTRPVHPVRGAALALLALVALGPVVQPWYLMWSLPLLAAGGVRARQWSVLGRVRTWAGEAPLTMYGIVILVVVSLTNGSVFPAAFTIPGAVASVLVIAVVLRRARASEQEMFGRREVFTLPMLRPARRAEPVPQSA